MGDKTDEVERRIETAFAAGDVSLVTCHVCSNPVDDDWVAVQCSSTGEVREYCSSCRGVAPDWNVVAGPAQP